MKLINKSRGTGKTTQLIYASAITGFRIITPNAASAKYVEKMAKDMGLKILQPISNTEYGSREMALGNHAPILIDDVDNEILDIALKLYFGAPVVAATMTVPIDDDCVPPCIPSTPKPLVFDHETEKIRMKTNRDVLHEVFGHIKFKVAKDAHHSEDALIIQTENDENFNIVDWLGSAYVEPKEENS